MASNLFETDEIFQFNLAVTIIILFTTVLFFLALLYSSSIYYLIKFRSLYRQKIPGNQNFPLRQVSHWIFYFLQHRRSMTGQEWLQYMCGQCFLHQKKGIWIFWSIITPFVFLFDPKTVEPILNSTENIQKGYEYALATAWLKDGLSVSKGDKWRRRRKLLTPSFHFRTLDQFFPIFNEGARVLCQKVESKMQKEKWIDVLPMTSLCALDIICETTMGTKINAQDNDLPYVQALHSACEILADRIIQPWLWPDFIYNFTSDSRKYNECMSVMDTFTRMVIANRHADLLRQSKANGHEKSSEENEREKNDVDIGRKSKRRLALLDLLLDEHFKDPSFTMDDIAEEVDNFMFAGHDTIASALTFALYMLGLHQDVQRQVREEINSVLGDDYCKPIELEDAKQFKYLDRVLKETRRLYPPGILIARDLNVDANIDGHIIPKGTNVGIFIYTLHRNPEVFPNPEVFDPDRFLPENTVGRHPCAYIPFSAGPRNCIGQKFAIYETLVVIATIIRYFDVKSRDTRDKFVVTYDLMVGSDPALFMKFTPRREIKKYGDLKAVIESED